MASRKHRQADRAAREQAQSSTGPAAPEERGQLLSVYRERRRRQDEHDTEQRQLRAARKAAGPSATERTLMTATADTYAGTRTDWHLDFVRLHSARRVDLRGTPEMDPRLVNRLSTAERMQARQQHTLAVAFLEKHAPAQARAYHAAFTGAGAAAFAHPAPLPADAPPFWLPWTPAERAELLEMDVAQRSQAALTVARHRLWAAVRHVLAACDGIVPEAVADYATARQGAIREAARKERVKHQKALAQGTADAAAVRRWRDR
jgi:hypothetical protein